MTLDACRRLCPELDAAAPAGAVLGHDAVRAEFRRRLRSFAAAGSGSSNRVVRALLLDEPASIDRGEMTDKGSINQRAVLGHRAALVEELYAEPRSPRVLTTRDE